MSGEQTPWAHWVRYARGDVEMAGLIAEAGGPAWGVCHHAQQAVEKGLKALLVARGDDPARTHNLVRLNAAVDPAVFGQEDEDVLAALTVWSTEQRYPADQPEPTEEDAGRALVFARRALSEIETLLTEVS